MGKSRGGRPWARKCAVIYAEEVECWICGHLVDFSLPYLDRLGKENPGYRSVDHIIPIALGGTDDRSNLKLSHLICNKLKKDMLIEEFRLMVNEKGIDLSAFLGHGFRFEGGNPQSRIW